jgi:hypothetical protein
LLDGWGASEKEKVVEEFHVQNGAGEYNPWPEGIDLSAFAEGMESVEKIQQHFGCECVPEGRGETPNGTQHGMVDIRNGMWFGNAYRSCCLFPPFPLNIPSSKALTRRLASTK